MQASSRVLNPLSHRKVTHQTPGSRARHLQTVQRRGIEIAAAVRLKALSVPALQLSQEADPSFG